MAGKITREQSYVTNQALQQSSLLSTTVFQGLIHSLSKDWNQPKESTTTAPPTVCTLVIPATCEMRAQEESQSTYRGRDSHSSVPSSSNSSAATSQVHTQTSTTETDYTRNAQCFITSLTISHKQLWCMRTQDGCSDREFSVWCNNLQYQSAKKNSAYLMLFVTAKCKENGSLCYLMLRSRYRCPW